MKRILIVLITVCSFQMIQAQGIGSFFSQKKTQKKYYLQQIAALQLQLGFLKDGYNITGKGLKAIGGNKDGEYRLHDNHYLLLAQVNPVIGESETVKEIYRTAEAIRSVFGTTMNQVSASKVMTEKELNYIRGVYSNLDSKLKQDMEELAMVITPGTLHLSDDERWKKVKAIQASVADKYAFSLSFTKKALFVSKQRKRELEDIERMKKLHNIKD